MKNPPPGRRIVLTIFGLFFAGIPLLIWIMQARIADSDRRAKASWIATDCVIQEMRHWQSDGGRPGHVSDGPIDVATIQYAYQFEGESYTSDKVDLRSIDGMHMETDRNYAMFIRGYRTGQHATCWVNPKDPSQAVLAIDSPPKSHATDAVLYPLFILIGITLIVAAWRLPAMRTAQKRPDPVYELDALLVEQTPMGLYCRFPRRRDRAAADFALAMMAGLIACTIGFGLIYFGLVAKQYEVPSASPSPPAVVEFCMFALFGSPFAAFGCVGMLYALFSTFGHSEVLVRGGQIYGGERAGWLWLGRSLPLREPVQFVVYHIRARPKSFEFSRPIQLHGTFAQVYHDQGLATLDVRTESGQRVTLAEGYPRETLLSWAEQIASVINQSRGSTPIVSSVGPYAPSTVTPDPTKLRPAKTRIALEETPALLRVVLPTENLVYRWLPWIVAICVAILVWQEPTGLSKSAIGYLFGMVLLLAAGFSYLLHVCLRQQKIFEVEKSRGELLLRRLGVMGEKRRIWSAQQRPAIEAGFGMSSGSDRSRPGFYFTISAVGTSDYDLGTCGLKLREQIWCAALINNALHAARESNTASAEGVQR